MIVYEITTPEIVFKEGAGDMLLLPGSEGDMGILAGHSPLVASLRNAPIYVYQNNNIIERFFVEDAYCEISTAACIILATRAYDLSQCDPQDCRERAEAKRAEAQQSDDEVVKKLLESKANMLELRALAVEKPVYK